MHNRSFLIVGLLFIASTVAYATKPDHEWLVGKILDENRARYFAGMLNNSSSNASENGTWNGSANSTSIGDSTTTQASGSYSGTRNTSTYGSSVPIYRVYDNLVIEGADIVYITSERIRWRWSKSAHVAVNGTVKYFVDGRKLHVLDDDNKEHTMEVIKEIRKVPPSADARAAVPQNNQQTTAITAAADPASQASVAIDSTPSGADIEIDGAFVGNTPSTIAVATGSHQITVKKKGYSNWSKTLNVTGGTVHLNAELDNGAPAK